MNEFDAAKDIVSTLQSHGHQAVFAGGAVRDMVMGLEPHDIDIATSASPDQVEFLFPRTVAVGKQFGVIVVLSNDREFEVATFRTDSKDSDGRRPNSINFATMEEDAQRRDLTINGLFFDPIENKIFDFVNGLEDIKDRLIVFIGDADERIKEDHLRMLRAVRFANRFGFDLVDSTKKALIRNAHLITVGVSPERIKDELDKMLMLEKPSKAIEMLKDVGLLTLILPEVDILWNQEQGPKWHSEGNCGLHTMMVLDEAARLTKDLNVRWAALLHDTGKPATDLLKDDGINHSFHGHENVSVEIAANVMERFKSSNVDKVKVVNMIANHMRVGSVLDMKRSTLRKLISRNHFDGLLTLFEADCKGSKPADPNADNEKMNGVLFLKDIIKTMEKVKAPRELPPMLISGNDIFDLGLKPSAVFRTLLDAITDMQLDGVISTREEALVELKKLVENM